MSDGRLVYSTDGSDRKNDLRAPPKPRRKGQPQRKPQVPDDGVVRVTREKAGRRGKEVTVVRGLPGNATSIKAIATELKRACGVGGFARDGVVEIQGDQRDRIVPLLEDHGFTVKLAGG